MLLGQDEDLIKLSIQGDIRAFEQLAEKYQHKIYNLAYRYMGCEEDASDMAQEALIKAYRSLATFKGESSLSTWLYRITTNVCLDELRKRRRTLHMISLDEPVATVDGDEIERDIADPSPTADIIYQKKETEVYIQSLINKLKPEQKAVVILRDVMGLTYEEIAEVLNCSIGTVKSRLSRGREILRKKIVKQELLP
ncbi:MAG: sigma-70 family RNA polymerase sigma factor [Syntrophomonadaceae bacterium]|nr:sigma-70 family RNA polymerase sigma factor [Syntrophomonadaceae bacterium]